MFPGVDGFSWTFGHVLFLSIFFTALLTIAGTVLTAMLRSQWRPERIERIRWREEFNELPARDRCCRHELSGTVEQRTCDNRFECGRCANHSRFQRQDATREDEVCGLPYPSKRLYHRGHTWVEPQADGTFLVGLDEIAARVVGAPDEIQFPPLGARLHTNGPGWSMKRLGYDVRVLAPVSGEVIQTGGAEEGYYLRIKPEKESPDVLHLLRGAEVRGWVIRELERLQTVFLPDGEAASLADGGELMSDVISNIPAAAWDTVLGHLFLEP